VRVAGIETASKRRVSAAKRKSGDVMNIAEERLTPKPHLDGIAPEQGGEQLSQRVRSLRLPHQARGGSAAGRWIVWTLCLALAGSTAVLGYLQFSQQASPASSQLTSAKSDSSADPVLPAAAVTASSGGLALEAKGYIIPAHQILVKIGRAHV